MSHRRLTIDDIPTHMVYVENITGNIEVLTIADDIRQGMLDYSLANDELDMEDLTNKIFPGYSNGTITWLYNEPAVHIHTITDRSDIKISKDGTN